MTMSENTERLESRQGINWKMLLVFVKNLKLISFKSGRSCWTRIFMFVVLNTFVTLLPLCKFQTLRRHVKKSHTMVPVSHWSTKWIWNLEWLRRFANNNRLQLIGWLVYFDLLVFYCNSLSLKTIVYFKPPPPAHRQYKIVLKEL